MRIKLTDIQRFSLHDGPGIRTTVFFSRCPLRCMWCHNPECQLGTPLLRFAPSRCIRCGACIDACPQKGHNLGGNLHTLERTNCELCGQCAAACPTGALDIIGRIMTPEEVMDEVRRDKPFYQTSGGGLTLSGGEPLAQAKAARALLQLAKAEAIHTAVETCGYVPYKTFEPLLDLVDLWLYDLKQLDPKRHRALTGAANRRILANLDKLLASGAQVILRAPIIPGQNDDEESIALLLTWIRRRRNLREVHLMPYNRLAESKYADIGLQYTLRGLQPPSQDTLAALKVQLEALGLSVRIGG